MYTRNYENAGRRTGTTFELSNTPELSDFKRQDQDYRPGGEELIIPREYHGEMLRPVIRSYDTQAPTVMEMVPKTNEGDTVSLVPQPVPQQAAPVCDSQEPTADNGSTADLIVSQSEEVPKEKQAVHSRSLFDGVLDLLFGRNSDEEETVLLLGVALLLLSGHMSRDRDSGSGWSEDDLALLLVGYLLLG